MRTLSTPNTLLIAAPQNQPPSSGQIKGSIPTIRSHSFNACDIIKTPDGLTPSPSPCHHHRRTHSWNCRRPASPPKSPKPTKSSKIKSGWWDWGRKSRSRASSPTKSRPASPLLSLSRPSSPLLSLSHPSSPCCNSTANTYVKSGQSTPIGGASSPSAYRIDSVVVWSSALFSPPSLVINVDVS